MIRLELICLGLFALVSPDDLDDYKAAKAAAGNDAASLIKLALWSERLGLKTERAEQLANALRADPKNALAHGLSGTVEYQGRWETPQNVVELIQNDENFAGKAAQYDARRNAIRDAVVLEQQREDGFKNHNLFLKANDMRAKARRGLAQAHLKLGLWCESNGLKLQAPAHFIAALHLDPYLDTAWRHLGYVKHKGRWIARESILAEEREAQKNRLAERRWETELRRLKTQLGERALRARAEEELAKIDDPIAVPAISRVFGNRNQADLSIAIRLLGQIDSADATRYLAEIALFDDVPAVKNAAIQALTARHPSDYAGMLVDMIHSPVRYEAQPIQGVGSRGSLVIDSKRFRLVRTYDAPNPLRLASTFEPYVGYGPDGLPVVMTSSDLTDIRFALHVGDREELGEARQTVRNAEARAVQMMAQANFNAEFARERLFADIKEIELANMRAEALNRRVASVLQSSLNAPAALGDDEDAWHIWWHERIGYRYEAPPKFSLLGNMTPRFEAPAISSCFVAGTEVWTLEGTRPIENLRVGDQVLSWDETARAPAYQPVVIVRRVTPMPTIRLTLDNGDLFAASGFHRFWRVGAGWTMLKDLKVGDLVRGFGDVSAAVKLEPAKTEPVYTLDVHQSRNFFVGEHAALVHDNTIPDPRVAPFDAVPKSSSSR